MRSGFPNDTIYAHDPEDDTKERIAKLEERMNKVLKMILFPEDMNIYLLDDDEYIMNLAKEAIERNKKRNKGEKSITDGD